MLAFAALSASLLAATDYHVSVTGKNSNPGTEAAPFLTIQHAAEQARPGDTITVHEGIYRERINPPRGGASDEQRIVFQAAPDAKVVIKGSEIIKNWKKVKQDTWKAVVSNEFFGDYNPYKTRIAGDWFRPLPKDSGRAYHTGTVYLNGHWLKEAASKKEVFKVAEKEALWFGEVDDKHTTIYAQFKGMDPNKQTIEVNAREAVFYPEQEGINYITVCGFTLEHAASNWAPPTAEQVGLIGTHWSKGWIIEDNIIRYSICTGITLGKHGDKYDNTSSNSAEGYVATINRALERGWSKDKIGSHMVRNNHVSYCEQAGIVGSLGAIFSTISGNVIHDINLREMLEGAEMAGIKFHGAVDTLIRDNHVYRCGGFGGIWLDWMTQGTRVTGNLLHDNRRQDLFVEVNHGPFLIDNNIFLSPITLRDFSTGGAYVHNLIAGRINGLSLQKRLTPYLKAHSTEIAGLHKTPGGDNRFLNNLFVDDQDLTLYDKFDHMTLKGNTFSKAKAKLIHADDGVYLEFESKKDLADAEKRSVITSDTLGKAIIADLPFVQPDGSDYRLDRNYFGDGRDKKNPAAGPFTIRAGKARIKVWAK